MWLLVQQDRGAAFLYACVCGLVIGLLYDFFRVARVIYAGGRIKLFFEDFLFCVMSAVVFVVYSYNAAMGSVRLFTVMGAILGFFVYRFTLGLLTVRVASYLKLLVSPPISAFKAFCNRKCRNIINKLYTYSRIRGVKSIAANGFRR